MTNLLRAYKAWKLRKLKLALHGRIDHVVITSAFLSTRIYFFTQLICMKIQVNMARHRFTTPTIVAFALNWQRVSEKLIGCDCLNLEPLPVECVTVTSIRADYLVNTRNRVIHLTFAFAVQWRAGLRHFLRILIVFVYERNSWDLTQDSRILDSRSFALSVCQLRPSRRFDIDDPRCVEINDGCDDEIFESIFAAYVCGCNSRNVYK